LGTKKQQTDAATPGNSYNYTNISVKVSLKYMNNKEKWHILSIWALIIMVIFFTYQGLM
jgi:hypothetical protein